MNYLLSVFYDTGVQNPQIEAVIGTYADQQVRNYLNAIEIDNQRLVTMIQYVSTLPTVTAVRNESFTGYTVTFNVFTRGGNPLELTLLNQSIKRSVRREDYEIGAIVDFTII